MTQRSIRQQFILKDVNTKSLFTLTYALRRRNRLSVVDPEFAFGPFFCDANHPDETSGPGCISVKRYNVFVCDSFLTGRHWHRHAQSSGAAFTMTPAEKRQSFWSRYGPHSLVSLGKIMGEQKFESLSLRQSTKLPVL